MTEPEYAHLIEKLETLAKSYRKQAEASGQNDDSVYYDAKADGVDAAITLTGVLYSQGKV
jgi:hypothetical protein